MLTPAINDVILIHEVPTNFVLDLMQLVQGADHPNGPQAYSKVSRTLHVPVTT